MDIVLMREVVTVASFTAFLGIVAWAAYPGNRKRFDEAARLPLDEGEEGTLTPALSQGRGSKA